jgi:hypothetical protein
LNPYTSATIVTNRHPNSRDRSPTNFPKSLSGHVTTAVSTLRHRGAGELSTVRAVRACLGAREDADDDDGAAADEDAAAAAAAAAADDGEAANAVDDDDEEEEDGEEAREGLVAARGEPDSSSALSGTAT